MKLRIFTMAILLFAAGAAAPAVAVAQTDTPTPEPGEESGNATSAETVENPGERGVIAVDENTVVVESEIVDGAVRLVIQSEVTQKVRIVDASDRITGPTQINFNDVLIRGGEAVEVRIPVANPDSPAVTVATPRGIVGVGGQQGGGGRSVSLLFGVGTGLTAGILAFSGALWKRAKADKEAPEVIDDDGGAL